MLIKGGCGGMDNVNRFVELYRDTDYPLRKIEGILGLSRWECEKLRRYCFREGLLSVQRRKGRKKQWVNQFNRCNPRYYCFDRNKGRFVVLKNGKYYACFKVEEDCKRFVELMIKCDWDKSRVGLVKELMCE